MPVTPDVTLGGLEEALAYLRRGWAPVPLCWPAPDGTCGCGAGHGGKGGKAALLPRYTAQTPTEDLVRRWWAARPRANVGLLLGPSELLVIDLDGPEALREARALGLPTAPTVDTGKGCHLYCRAPSETPGRTRAIHRGVSGRIDVLRGGHVCAPPSLHPSQARYTWRDGAGPDDLTLPDAPAWAVAMLRPLPVLSPPTVRRGEAAPAGRGYRLPARLHYVLRDGWEGSYPSRSEGVWAVAHGLLRAGCPPERAVELLCCHEWTWAGHADPRGWLADEVARALAKG